jgi:subtilase-type serine protease
MNVTTTTLGLRSAASFMLGDAPSQIRGMVGWQHAFGDVTPLANLVLVGGSPFTVSGVPIARNSALVEVGLDVRLSEKVSLGATYTGQFASGTQDQAVRANVTLDF